MKNRIMLEAVKRRSVRKTGRVLVLTGARQTGKTTLVHRLDGDYAYLSLDDPTARPAFAALSAHQWHQLYPQAILDEVQKAPSLVDSVKAVCDQHEDARYILLGSSQIVLLKQIRESLAGRATILELFPLILPEALTSGWESPIVESRMVRWLTQGRDPSLLAGVPVVEEKFALSSVAFDRYLRFGGMPVMADRDLEDEERQEWLDNYIRTYLQRDVRDLANIRDLEPFVKAQKAIALATARTVNYSGLAQLCGTSPNTVTRFLNYLELSYQAFVLPAWHRNPNKRLAKAPKVHMLDPGIMRAVVGRRGELTGHEFESAVVAEIHKQIKTHRLPVDAHHLRTVDGREVDLLLELEEGFIPIEIKQASSVRRTDARHLVDLEAILDKPVLHSFLLSNDPQIQSFSAGLTALPIPWFLS